MPAENDQREPRRETIVAILRRHRIANQAELAQRPCVGKAPAQQLNKSSLQAWLRALKEDLEAKLRKLAEARACHLREGALRELNECAASLSSASS